ncbi:MAG: hypothetical protein HKM87_05440 [Ignavibacteriaceae bacterium]|nr:hypothetical protein [Ignavibacteriaceae bacterium]
MKNLFITTLIFGVLLFTNSVFAQKDIEKSFSVKSHDNLNLSTSMGNISIDTWNKNEVNVIVKNILDSEVNLLSMKQSGDKVEVKFKGDDSDNIRFEITIPSELNLELATGGGNINLMNDLKGILDASTAGGNISTKNIYGEADISSAGGNIKVGDVNNNVDISTAGGDINVGSINGVADISTAGGNIKVGSVNNSADISTAGGNISIGNIDGNADVSTAGGNISVDKVSGGADISTAGGNINLASATGIVEANTGGGNIKLKNIKGSIEANTGAGNIYAELIPEGNKNSELNSGVGNITLKVPETAKVTIVATAQVLMWDDESELQNIKSEFAPTTVNRYGNKKQIEATFKLNGGGSLIELNVALGNINIQKL